MKFLNHPKLRTLPYLIALQCCVGSVVLAGELPLDLVERSPSGTPALTVSGPSGAMTVPDGRVLPDGDMAVGFNNHQESRFFKAKRGENYLFGIGLLPYVEFSGRLANYPVDRPSDPFIRDLSANLKVSIPKLFDQQPDVAFGINDIGGGAPNFRSKYIAASERFGPLNVTLGVARGKPYLNGLFGAAEWALGESGLSLLAERNSGLNSAGIRYASSSLAGLANARIVTTAQRTVGAHATDGSKFDRSTLGLALVIPFGENARAVRISPAAPVATSMPATVAQTPAAVSSGAAVANAAPAPIPGAERTPGAPSDPASLQQLQTALEKAGLERVRVGMAGSKLIIEYENHRYNRNEVDAIGIAFGLGARLAPAPVKRIGVITKKSGLALYETSVDRGGYRRFLEDADPYQVIAGLQSEMRPLEGPGIAWLDRAEGRRGYSRILVQPVIRSFVGTEIGLFDYSLAASVQGSVPLWKGAEASVDYVVPVTESENIKNGQFSYASQRSGVRSALFTQSLWLTDRLLNVFSAGKLQYDFTGFQNEATYFVPGRDDQIRLEYSRLQFSDAFFRETRVNAGAFYRLTVAPLDLWVEAGYSQYVGNDRGPSISFSHWFGDIEAQAYLRRGDQTTFAGFRLAFPLTPRQGMRPGLTHIEGPGRFAYGLETKLARQGGDNRITRGVAEEMPMAYSARYVLLNRGRVGEDYMLTQLPRMREAALLFSPLD